MMSQGVTKVLNINPLVISIVKRVIPLMIVRVGRPISKTHPKTKVIVTRVTCKDTKHKITEPKS